MCVSLELLASLDKVIDKITGTYSELELENEILDEYGAITKKLLNNNMNTKISFIMKYNLTLLELKILDDFINKLSTLDSNHVNKELNSFIKKLKMIDFRGIESDILREFLQDNSENFFSILDKKYQDFYQIQFVSNWKNKYREIIESINTSFRDFNMNYDNLIIDSQNSHYLLISDLYTLFFDKNINTQNLNELSMEVEFITDYITPYFTRMGYFQSDIFKNKSRSFRQKISEKFNLNSEIDLIEDTPLIFSSDILLDILDDNSNQNKYFQTFFTFRLLKKIQDSGNNINAVITDIRNNYNMGFINSQVLIQDLFFVRILHNNLRSKLTNSNYLLLGNILYSYNIMIEELKTFLTSNEFKEYKDLIIFNNKELYRDFYLNKMR